MWIADAERSREIDHLAQTEFGIAGSDLMERAGKAVFDAAREMLPDGGRFGVVCGKGNNGGDGFVVARLAKQAGQDVQCIVSCPEQNLGPVPADKLRLAREAGVVPVFVGAPNWEEQLNSLRTRDLVIDALLGTGARGEMCGPVVEVIRAVNSSGVPVLAVDVPSGIHCDTGEELGDSIWAARTVTFGLPKPFLFQGIGLEHAGYWTVADIGYPAGLLNEPTSARLLECEWVGALLPERLRSSHKGDNGTVLIVAGSHRMRGAALLAAKSAVRAGAGLVTVAAIESVCDAVIAGVPEATLLPLPESNGAISHEAWTLVVEQQARCDSAIFGPGLTQSNGVIEFLDHVWRLWDLPCCIDADALNCVAAGVKLPRTECVLTPHPGEMARLLNASIAEIQADRFENVIHCVERYGKTVLLKGPYSTVGEAFQPMLVNSTGNSGMASAGMGDVLSGIVGTLLAQDLPAFYAGGCGMFWHGYAGDICADRIGPVGYTARDLAQALPEARAKITLACDDCF